MKLFQQETVYQRCFWKKPLLAEAQLSDLPEKQHSLHLPDPDGPPGETAERHHPSYSLVQRAVNMCHEQAFHGGLFSHSEWPRKKPIHKAAFSCSSSAFPPSTDKSFTGLSRASALIAGSSKISGAFLIDKPLLRTRTEAAFCQL